MMVTAMMYKRLTDTHREALSSVLGAPPDLCPLEAKVLSEESLDTYRRLKVEYQVHPGEFVPAYVLIPYSSPMQPTPAIICLHRHNHDETIGKSEIVGLAGDPDAAIGVELVKRGYVVLAPDAVGFEERASHLEADWDNNFRELASRLLRGETLLKKVTWDVSRGLDYLETLPMVDKDKVAVIGQEYASLLAMWVAALDERVTVATGHGFWTSMRELVSQKMPILPEFTVPRLLQVADYDRVLAQIAPRPFLISAMKNDPTSYDPQVIYTKASELYEAFEIENTLTFYHHDSHQEEFPAHVRESIYAWLDMWLNLPS